MLDITNICRICLKEEDPKLPIFTENDERSESKPTLPEKIMSFARVKVVKDDRLPMYICVKCYCQVDTAVEFKRLCEESFHFFKRQLDLFSDFKVISPSLQDENKHFDGYDSCSRTSDPSNYGTGIQSPFTEAVSFSQHHILPEDCEDVEEYGPECETEGEPATQVFRITGCDVPCIDSGEKEFNHSVTKYDTVLDYQNLEIDLSNVKIENDIDTRSDEEQENTLEINAEGFQDAKYPFLERLLTTSNKEKSCKCRSCQMIFSNRREMGFHISFAHRRCGTCGQYFYSNKDKDEHVCKSQTQTDKILQPMATAMDADKETNRENGNFIIPRKTRPKRKTAEVKIKCSLCEVVCLNEKGFRRHLKCMHAGHRMIYPCFMCKSRQFFSKVSCIKHLMKKHGVSSNGKIQFELKHMINRDTNARGLRKRKLSGNHCKSKKKINNPKMQCLDQIKKNNPKKKVTELYKSKGKGTEISSRKFLRQSHPPFSLLSPIIKNNFSVTLDHKGIKRYICRWCDVMYKGYVAAYNHYYTYSKRKMTEEEDLVMDGKPYGCKSCPLKFASGSQAMMHRIHAHKCFYKKCALEKK